MAAAAPASPSPRKAPPKTPQGGINDFWHKFSSRKPSKVTSIFPRLLYASLLPQHPDPRGLSSARNARESYEAAAAECREKVEKIVRECHRTNEMFTDSDFDIESDWVQNCLRGLWYEADDESSGQEEEEVKPEGGAAGGQDARTRADPPDDGAPRPVPGQAFCGLPQPQHDYREEYSPGSIHRLQWVFKDPQFTIGGFSSTDIQQGKNGDCWWLAAVSTIAHRKDLMERVCVARDEECGVYGFVFYRDGEWVSTVVDDNFYLRELDFRVAYPDVYDPTGEKAKKHRLHHQTGSEALYFGHCSDPNETWLPLLEKAYAKAHGDYNAIAGGWSGEGVEDMTGGVTTTIATRRVLKKDKLWKEMAFGNGDFVFALSALGLAGQGSASGVVLQHAYSILRATEEVDEDGTKLRLVQIRNPWGKRDQIKRVGEWEGAWGDGAREWTPYLLKKLNHRFGDDGVFWMSFDDMLETFIYLHRTRIFDQNWNVIQQWNSCDVSWFTGYLRTKFVVDVKTAGTIVLVLAQLDDRYFRGLVGQYKFSLHFLLKKEGSPQADYICRVRPCHAVEHRSVSCELHLEPGRYEVLPKITATRDKTVPALDKVIKQFTDRNPQKLRQVGMQYDLAHAKGGIVDEDLKVVSQKEKEKKKAAERKKKEKAAKTSVEVKIEVGGDSNGEVTVKTEGKEPAKDEEGENTEDASEKPDKVERLEKEETHDAEAKESLELRLKDRDEPPTASGGGEQHPDKGDQQVPTEKSKKEDAKKDDGGKDEKKEDAKKEDDGKNKKEDGGKNKKEDVEKSEEKEDEKSSDDSDTSDSEEDDDDGEARWNAVCVTCLRVYSQDKDLTISLVKPEDAEEASSLVQGHEPAGATM